MSTTLCLLFSLVLPGCSATQPSKTPSFYARLDQTQNQVDRQAAVNMVSTYRHGMGLGILQLDPRLNALAQEMTQAMAQADSLSSSLQNKPLAMRLAQKGYYAITADENVSAGYRTLAEAFSGWRESKKHDAVMRLASARHMGIATAYAPNSKYKIFWVLIVAADR